MRMRVRWAVAVVTGWLIVAAPSPFAAARAAAQRDAPLTLTSGTRAERAIGGDERQSFTIELAADDFLHVVVDQLGTDVALRLNGPDGSNLIEADSPNGSSGPERIAHVAVAPGSYRIEVHSLSPSGSPGTGRYRLTVVAHRPAQAADWRFAEGERLFAEGARQLVSNTAASRRTAHEQFVAAERIFDALGLRYQRGLASFNLGVLELRAGQPREALPYLTSARAAFDRIDSMYASVVNALGGAFDLTGDPEAALVSYRDALSLAVAASDTTREATIRNNIGILHAALAEWPQAILEYRRALDLFRGSGDRRREGLALFNIGVSYSSLGQVPRAIEYLEQSLTIRRAAGDRAAEASTLTQLGLAATLSGDLETALKYFDAALPLRQVVGDRRNEGITLTHLGGAHLAAGQPARALEVLQRAADLRGASGDRRGQAVALIGAAEAQASLGRLDDSLARASEAEATLRAVGDTNRAGEALVAKARAQRLLGRLDDARASIEAAMTAFETVRGRVTTAETSATYLGRHQDVYAIAIDVLMRLDGERRQAGFDARALQVSERARARGLLDMLNEGSADLRRGVDASLVERERQLARLLDAKADRLFAAQAARTQGEADALARDTQTLEAEYEEVRARIRATSPEYSALTQPQPLDIDAIRRDVLDADTTLVEYALGPDASYAWVLDRQNLRTFRLAPRAEIERAAREAYELVTSRAKNVPRETPAARARRIATSDAALPAALRRVSDLILAPITTFPTTTRLLIVADGALQYLPFEMLPAPRRAQAQPLVAGFEITALPSASTLAVHRAQLARRTAPTKGVAVFADPVFDVSDARVRPARLASAAPATPDAQTRLLTQTDDAATPGFGSIARLRFTGDEAKAILAAAQGRQNFAAVGFDATKAAAVDTELGTYRYLHFATHGFLDTARPSLSAIALSLVSRDGAAQEGFLRAHELYNLNLSADLVVLSACETGLGKEIRGEGLIGLTRAFMYAGAARVIVSLWSVSDRATAELMGRLYREMLRNGRTPSASLRAAQLALRSDSRWQHPYYWAAFTIQGDWR